jgi:hypothetical protein
MKTTHTDATPGYNNKIPEQIMTPDTVETRISTLEFSDGFPAKPAREPAGKPMNFIDPELRGLAARIGICKYKPRAPNACEATQT